MLTGFDCSGRQVMSRSWVTIESLKRRFCNHLWTLRISGKTNPSLAGLKVLKQNCGPIQSLRCGPTWVTISTCDSHLSSWPPLGCLDKGDSRPKYKESISGFPWFKGGWRSFVAFGGFKVHWPKASTYIHSKLIEWIKVTAAIIDDDQNILNSSVPEVW